MTKRLNSHEVARWFIFNNPSLAQGYFDENAKINKLLFFASLMYYCVTKDILLDESFVAFPNGPVIKSIYRDYRYNGLDKMPYDNRIEGIDMIQNQVLNIVNFVYGEKTANNLIEITHTQSLWKDVADQIPNNPVIDFIQTPDTDIEHYSSLYNCYKNVDFSRYGRERINGNVYYYDRNNLEMTDSIIEQLSTIPSYGEPQFVELVEGELVFS